MDEEVRLYLPPEALQGQDIPCHITWKNLQWRSIRVGVPPGLEVRELFNVSGSEFYREERMLEIRSLEREGYIGISFISNKLHETSEDLQIDVTVLLINEEHLRFEKRIHLFRPSLIVCSTPCRITISSDGEPSDKILLRKNGYGTMMVSVKSTEDSEIKDRLPKELEDATLGFVEDLSKGLEALKKKYPQSEEFLNKIASLDFGNQEEAFAETSTELEVLDPDRVFVTELINTIVSAMFDNFEFESLLIRSFTKYIDESVGKNIIFTTPFNEIDVPSNETRLTLNIECKDIKAKTITSQDLLPIKVFSDSPRTIKIRDLIEWENK